MIEKQSVVDQIEITRSGTLQIRIGLEIVEDGKILSGKWHRTSIEPSGNVDEQMKFVNDHLLSMGEAQVSQQDIDKIKAYHSLKV